MSQAGYTPISLYYSTTALAAPAAGNLANGELAINITDGKLYYKDDLGAVQLIASKAGASGSVTSVGVSGGTTGLTTSGGPVTTSGTITLAGTLVAANGGTGLSSYAAGDLIYASGTTTISKLTIGTSNQILTSSGTAPQWTSGSSITVGTATNLASGAAGSVPYQTGSGATTFLSIGTSNQILTSSGTAPQWTSASSISIGTATNLAGGATGSVPYQSAAGTTTFLAAGTNGYVLTLAGGVPTWAASTGISTGKSIAMAMIFGG